MFERHECHKSVTSFVNPLDGGIYIRSSCLTCDWHWDIAWMNNASAWLEADAAFEQHACEQLAPYVTGWQPEEPLLGEEREI